MFDKIQVCRLLENAFFFDFSGNFRVHIYIQLNLNQRVSKSKIKKNRRIEWKIFQGCFKKEKEKTTHKETEFHNSTQD